MSNNKRELDDFWNIELITPVKKYSPPRRKNTDAVEIDLSSENNTVEIKVTSVFESEKLTGITDENGTLRRFVTESEPRSARSECEVEYKRENSLVHKVRLYKLNSRYKYYEDFCRDAEKFLDLTINNAEKVDFFSYVPQYNQMNGNQFDYYIYFRTQARNGNFIDIGLSYLLLYCYELINLGDQTDVNRSLTMLCALWKAYKDKFPYVKSHLIEWICDFCLIHRLPPPSEIEPYDIADVCTLKEFFVSSTENDDYRGYAEVLLSFANSYDYKKSKFAHGKERELYDMLIPNALSECVKQLSDGGLLKNVSFSDSVLPREAFSGALCSHRVKYRIEVEYCSFSRTNELRYLVGDIVKYCENKIRAYLGIKSRLSCYSLDSELRGVLDRFFENNLGKPKRVKKIVRQEYDVLYDLPKKELSLSDASRIEAESWETTKSLVEAFETDEDIGENLLEKAFAPISENISEDDEGGTATELSDALSEYKDFIKALIKHDREGQRSFAKAKGMMTDAVVDAVNTVAEELIGDILIDGDGEDYEIIEDYFDLIKEK